MSSVAIGGWLPPNSPGAHLERSSIPPRGAQRVVLAAVPYFPNVNCPGHEDFSSSSRSCCYLHLRVAHCSRLGSSFRRFLARKPQLRTKAGTPPPPPAAPTPPPPPPAAAFVPSRPPAKSFRLLPNSTTKPFSFRNIFHIIWQIFIKRVSLVKVAEKFWSSKTWTVNNYVVLYLWRTATPHSCVSSHTMFGEYCFHLDVNN